MHETESDVIRLQGVTKVFFKDEVETHARYAERTVHLLDGRIVAESGEGS
jgi:hypothetical protein